MKAIMTKYLAATLHLPARIKAWDMDGNSVTLPCLLQGDDTRRAVEAFCRKMGLKGRLIGGGSTRNGMAFVWVHKYSANIKVK
jgi:hypothetical protein